MAVLDNDFRVDATLTEGGDGIWSPPKPAPAGAARDFQSRYEQQRSRAEAAEARCEELRWAEVAARSDAGSWKLRFRSCRRRLSEAVEEAKDLRRAARAAPSLPAAVVRLETLLSEAGIASDETGSLEALSKEVVRLREALAEPEGMEGIVGWHSGEARRDRASPEEARLRVTIRTLRKDITRLNREVGRGNKAIGELHKKLDQEKERAESIRETGKKLSRENLSLHREVRILGEAEARARSLSDEAFWLRHALDVSKAGKKKLATRIAKLRAAGATLSKLPFDEAAHLRNVLRRSRRQKTTIDRLCKENARLRKAVRAARTGRQASQARLARLRTVRKTLSASLTNMDAELRRVLRRSRRQKATIKSLSRENARLRKAVKGSRRRIEMLEAQLEKLRATGTVLSKKLYGRKSEQQDKPRSERKRGKQRGAPGHGRTQRPGLEERVEEHNPPADACICGQCGQPYAPNGAEQSSLIEIEVKAHKRVISRPRWRRTCECASSPMEVSAPPVPRLFPRTPYGISFWARFLFEHCACFRPVHRVAAWFFGHGLPVSPGTLADSLKRFVPLFEPLFETILAHQNTAALRHADETSWRVQELRGDDRSSRGLAVGLGQQRRGLLPYRPFAQRRSGAQAVRRGPPLYGHRLRPLQRLQAAGEPSRGPGDPCVLLEPRSEGFYRVRGRPSEADPMVPGMDRADRGDLPAERGAAGALRPRARAPDAGVRRDAGRADASARWPVRGRQGGAGRPAGPSARGQGAALAAQPPRGAVRLRRSTPDADGQ